MMTLATFPTLDLEKLGTAIFEAGWDHEYGTHWRLTLNDGQTTLKGDLVMRSDHYDMVER
jgi:hypothetical protein